MIKNFNLYMDDSGTRHPDHQLDTNSTKADWFGLGGVLVHEDHMAACRRAYGDFCSRWPQVGDSALHSEEIRHRKKNFRWLKYESTREAQFLTDLQGMLTTIPVLGIACIIDRRGYHHRYHPQYGTAKWSLCRTAFSICVERACKYAQQNNCRLNVFVERSDKKTDRNIRKHFDDLKTHGQPFSRNTSSKYAPLSKNVFAETLCDFRIKTKSSVLMQIADLYLYPMCQGGYNRKYRPYTALSESGHLIDSHVLDSATEGIKYSCFELALGLDQNS